MDARVTRSYICESVNPEIAFEVEIIYDKSRTVILQVDGVAGQVGFGNIGVIVK